MGTVPMGTGELRKIHSRVAWIFLPVDKIHHRVRPPLDGPAHLLDFLLDARGDGGIADVGVDFDQKIAPDDHRLQFGMIDVAGNDRRPARDFIADKFRGDLAGDRGSEGLPGC